MDAPPVVAAPSPPPPPPSPFPIHVFLAEFDINQGSFLKYQYPEGSGLDEHLMAEHMLPDGAHDREQDWTVFFLNQIPSLTISSYTPTTDTINSNEGTSAGGGGKKQAQERLYVISLVRTKMDSSVRRGALVKALAVATPWPFCQIWKPLLIQSLESYFLSPSPYTLQEVYSTVSSLDFSSLPPLSRNEKLILRSTERGDIFDEKFIDHEDARSGGKEVLRGDDGEVLRKSWSTDSLGSVTSFSGIGRGRADTVSTLGSGSVGGNTTIVNGGKPMNTNAGRRRDTRYWDTKISYQHLVLPIRVPLAGFDEEVGDYSLITLYQTFTTPVPSSTLHPHLHSSGANTPPLIVLFNAMLTGKRIIFLGHQLPASLVADHVLAACALGSGCGVVIEGLVERAFPYTGLGNVDGLLEVPGFIAGVCNPAFSEKTTWWDVLCDISTGKITVSKDILFPSSNIHSVSPPPSISGSSISPDGVSELGVSLDGVSIVSGAAAGNTGAGTGGNYDLVFIEEISNAIQAHYGESIIRSRITDYVSRILRLTVKYEEESGGIGTVGYASRIYKPGQLGSGGEEVVGGNGGRIEGWKATEGFRKAQAAWKDKMENDLLGGVDVGHQLTRLRSGKRMSSGEAELIMKTLVEIASRGDEAIIAILAQLPPHFGGLLPLSFGLFHPNEEVRWSTVDLLDILSFNPTGKKFVQGLNAFHRSAYNRLSQDRQAASIP